MCRKTFAYCKCCSSFYPSNRRVKVTKEECNAFPNCDKVSRFLIDTRHVECKQVKKRNWFGRRKNEDVQLPLDHAAAKKVDKLEARRKRRAEQVRNPFDDIHQIRTNVICELPAGEPFQGSAEGLTSFVSGSSIVEEDRDEVVSKVEAPKKSKNNFWAIKDIAAEYRNLLSEPDFS